MAAMVPLPLLDSPGGAVNWPTINGMVGAARTHAPADMVAGMKDRLKSESASVVTNTLTVRPLRQRCRPAARCCSADAPLCQRRHQRHPTRCRCRLIHQALHTLSLNSSRPVRDQLALSKVLKQLERLLSRPPHTGVDAAVAQLLADWTFLFGWVLFIFSQ